MASGFLRITPIPVQGASTRTLSYALREDGSGAREKSFSAVSMPGEAVREIVSRSARMRVADTSAAMMDAFPPERAERCVVFPPGAAHASRILFAGGR